VLLVEKVILLPLKRFLTLLRLLRASLACRDSEAPRLLAPSLVTFLTYPLQNSQLPRKSQSKSYLMTVDSIFDKIRFRDSFSQIVWRAGTLIQWC
jgi:hypothetical protein